MATIDPHDGSDVDGQVARFHEALMSALRAAVERTAKRLDPLDPVHSSGIMRTFWQSKVDGLLENLESVVDGAAAETRDRLQLLVTPVTAGGDLHTLVADAFEIPTPAELFAEIYLRSRERFIVNLGTDAWNDIKLQLIDGMNAGEGFPELRARVTSVADMQQSNAERIARTEVVGAVNAGAIEQVRASKLNATKTWLATNDGRTRQSHRDVDGTTVRLDETFLVGGIPMDRPHDPAAPAEEVIQCRCTLTFEISEDAITAAVFGKPDQPRDYHGRWGHGGIRPKNGKSAYDYVAENQSEISDPAQRDALRGYIADSNELNARLRRNKSRTLVNRDAVAIKKTIDQHGALTDEPLLVHRGIGGVSDVLKTNDPTTLVGSKITDFGFMSTTAHRNVAERFVGKRDSAILDITVPPKTKVLAVDAALGSTVQGERELLLENSTTLQINDARMDRGVWIISAEVV